MENRFSPTRPGRTGRQSQTALFTLTSGLHSETPEDALSEPFIRDIEKALGESFDFHGDDFSGYGGDSGRTDVIYVRTGGTEGLFKALDLPGHIRLLTSGQSNSLAASMEILAFLRRNGRSGEILHGTAGEIASRLHGSKLIRPLPHIDLGGIRLGVIGKPSDWLIASDVDAAGLKERLNAELVEIPMEELLRRLALPEEDMRGFKGSEAIYSALREIVSEYGLGGLTIRCFDLLDTVHNTGCLALARLNAEGIPASCEGDIPALVTMAWLQKTRGCPGFQCNLSRIDGNKLLFAHCTVPLSMVTSYRYDTHFESGIGTAIKGELPSGDVEICKISPDLKTYVAIPGRLLGNCSEPCLCRTQVIVESPPAVDYVLHSPLANHHVIVPAVSKAEG